MSYFILKKTKLKLKALTIIISILLGLIVNYCFSFSKEFWIVLSAFLLSYAPTVMQIRQLTANLFVLIAGILTASILIYLPFTFKIATFLCISYISICVVTYAQNNKFRYIIFSYCIIIFIFLFASDPQISVNLKLLDCVIGSVIALVITRIIMPINIEKKFRTDMIKLLKGLNHYSKNLMNSPPENNRFEKILYAQRCFYPEWVYELGFNPGLRAGFRYFLLTLDKVIETLSSLTFYLPKILKTNDTEEVLLKLQSSMKINNELFQILIHYFEHRTVEEIRTDLVSDLTQLQSILQNLIPNQVELLEVMSDQMIMTLVFREIKELRELLLQLLATLQNVQVVLVPDKVQ